MSEQQKKGRLGEVIRFVVRDGVAFIDVMHVVGNDGFNAVFFGIFS